MAIVYNREEFLKRSKTNQDSRANQNKNSEEKQTGKNEEKSTAQWLAENGLTMTPNEDIAVVENGKVSQPKTESKPAPVTTKQSNSSTNSSGAAAPSSSDIDLRRSAADQAAKTRTLEEARKEYAEKLAKEAEERRAKAEATKQKTAENKAFDFKKAQKEAAERDASKRRAKEVTVKKAVSEEGIQKAKEHQEKLAEEKKNEAMMRVANSRASIPIDTQNKTAQENATSVKKWLDERRAKREQEERKYRAEVALREKREREEKEARRLLLGKLESYPGLGYGPMQSDEFEYISPFAMFSAAKAEYDEARKLYDTKFFENAQRAPGNDFSHLNAEDEDAMEAAYKKNLQGYADSKEDERILGEDLKKKKSFFERIYQMLSKPDYFVTTANADPEKEDYAESGTKGLKARSVSESEVDVRWGGITRYVDKNNKPNWAYSVSQVKDEILSDYDKIAQCTDSVGRILMMEEDELETYNYYFGRGDYKAAEQYLFTMETELNARWGEFKATSHSERPDKSDFAKNAYVVEKNFSAGMWEGVVNLGQAAKTFLLSPPDSTNPYVIKPDALTAEANALTRRADEVGDNWLRTAAQVSRAAGGQVVPIASNLVVPGTGKLLNVAASAGGSYRNAMLEGKEHDAAYTYGLGTGAITYGSESLFNGVTALGKGVLTKAAGKTAGEFVDAGIRKLVKSPAARSIIKTALQTIGLPASEALEEVSENLMDNALRNALFNEQNSLNPLTKENFESALVGYLTAGVMNLPHIRSMYKSNEFDFETKQKMDDFAALQYVTGASNEKFDDLTPDVQRAVQNAFKDNPDELQALIKRNDQSANTDTADSVEPQTGTLPKEAQAAVNDMLSPLEKKGRIDYLSDDDLESYAKAGNQHAQHRKAELIDKGIKPIMTSKKDVDAFIEQSLDGKLDSQIRAFSKATERMVKDIKDKTDDAVNVDGYFLELNSDDVFHLRDHTEEKKFGQKNLSRDEIKNIPLYMTSYDDVIDVHVQKDGRMTMIVGKKINGHSVLVSIVSSGRKALILKTAYVLSTEKYEMVVNSKKSAKSQETTISQSETMPNTSDNVPTIALSKDIVSQRSSIVNSDSSPKSDNAPAGVENFDVQKKDVNPELQKMLDDHDVLKSSDGSVRTLAQERAAQAAKKKLGNDILFSGADSATHQEAKGENAPRINPEEIAKLDVSDNVKREIESSRIKVDTSEAFAEKAKRLDVRQRGKLAQIPRNLLAKFFKIKLMDEPLSMLTRDIRKRCEIAAGGDAELEKFLYDGFLKYIDDGQKIGTSREMRDATAVYKFMNEIGIKPDSKEDAAAQMLGEGYWQDQYGERHAYTLQDVKREFPKTWEKIVQLKDFARGFYDRLADEGNRDLTIIHPDAISYYEAEMEKKRGRIEELRDKPGYVQIRIRVLESELAKVQSAMADLRGRKESRADIRRSLDAIEGKKELATQSYEARKRKDTKAAAADEARVARYADKAQSVQWDNESYIDNQLAALERKQMRLEADLRKQQQKISEASLETDAKEISKLELEIRDIENGLQTGELIRDKRILRKENYFHHRKAEKSSAASKFIALLEKRVAIDPELVGTSRETKPKRRFEGFMQHQGMEDYTPGALAGLLEYIPQVHRKVSSDYVLVHGREFAKSLALATKDTKNANGLLEHMTEYLNIMAGKTSFLDRAPQMLKGRKFLRFIDISAGLRKKSLFPFSFTIAMKQFSNISNLPYHVKNPASVAKGLWDMKDLFFKNSEKSRIIAQSGFLNERYIDKFYRKLDAKISPSRLSSFMLEAGDQLAANIIWFSAYEDAVRKKDKLVLKKQALGKYADPILYADNITRQCVGGRGRGELPPVLESKTVKAMFPFVVESMNSQHNFTDAVRKGDVLGVLFSQLITASINAGLGALGLGAVGFDFVEAAVDIFDIFFGEDEDGEDEDEEETLTDKSKQAAQRLGAELIESRWYSPMLSMFAGTDAWQSLLGDAYDDNVLSNELLAFSPIADAIRKNDIREIFYGYLPAGAQLKRTKSFLQDMGHIPEIRHNFDDWFSYVPRQGIAASYTDNDELRFPIERTFGNYFKGILFGEYATKEGKAYIDEGRKPMSAEHTGLFEYFVHHGHDGNQIYDYMNDVLSIQGEKKTERRRRAIMDMLYLDADEKHTFDEGIMGESKVDYTSEETFFDTAYDKKRKTTFYLMDLGMDEASAERIIEEISKIEGDKDETGNTIKHTERRKRVLAIYRNKNLTDEQKAILYREYVVNGDGIYKPYYLAKACGFDDETFAKYFAYFMMVEPAYKSDGKAVPLSKNKNVRRLANALGLTQEQKDAVYYYFYSSNSKELKAAEAKILNKLYKKLTPEQKKDFEAWYKDDDKRVDEKALLKVLEGLN